MKTCPQCHTLFSDEVGNCPHDNTPLVESVAWPEGAVIAGKYRILSRLGQDIACTVYKALQLKTEEPRTLKVLNDELASDPDFVGLFEQDALARKKIKHPNVARVEGIDAADDGRPFIVMEYVDGASLREIMQRDAPISPSRTCAIARQVAAGLEAAHALGVVHRDVKPESIFLSGANGGEKVKLLGLGISGLKEALVGNRFRSSPEAVIGTFQYLSPEQALGKTGEEVDGRADLYSLGVIMYQMLTGESPFKATTAADWMMAHIQGIPTPIRVAYAKLAIPDALIDLVTYCMKKDPAERPASARDLVRAIEYVEKEIERLGKVSAAPPKKSPRQKSSGWKFWKD